MRALIVYESMYGNTRRVAEAIGRGLGNGGSSPDVAVVPVTAAADQRAADWDLLVVGGPTHIHGMSREATRRSAVDVARSPGSGLDMEPGASDGGLREWLESLQMDGGKAAVFATRADGPALFTGSAAKGLAKALHHHGFELVAEPESFLVDGQPHLLAGEEQRAQQWGQSLATRLGVVTPQLPTPDER
ncbi:MAG TPA: flavodoxin domain-containing protein [Arthrobacter sp.]|nr:flavodoxin domain-containing protein [Arthrobacter sp.]